MVELWRTATQYSIKAVGEINCERAKIFFRQIMGLFMMMRFYISVGEVANEGDFRSTFLLQQVVR